MAYLEWPPLDRAIYMYVLDNETKNPAKFNNGSSFKETTGTAGLLGLK